MQREVIVRHPCKGEMYATTLPSYHGPQMPEMVESGIRSLLHIHKGEQNCRVYGAKPPIANIPLSGSLSDQAVTPLAVDVRVCAVEHPKGQVASGLSQSPSIVVQPTADRSTAGYPRHDRCYCCLTRTS